MAELEVSSTQNNNSDVQLNGDHVFGFGYVCFSALFIVTLSFSLSLIE